MSPFSIISLVLLLTALLGEGFEFMSGDTCYLVALVGVGFAVLGK